MNKTNPTITGVICAVSPESGCLEPYIYVEALIKSEVFRQAHLLAEDLNTSVEVYHHGELVYLVEGR